MRAGETVNLQQVKARWAYGEIQSPRLAAFYQTDPRVLPLSARIKTAAFESLSASDIHALVDIFETFRGSYLRHYFTDVHEFRVERWTAEQLERVYVMSEVDPTGAGRYRPFAVYAAERRPNGPYAALDPRVAADKVPPNAELRASDPLIVGQYKDFRVLIDGYFRGLIFMRSATPDDRVAVLVPIGK
jgi:hypothetical protein